MNTFTVRILNQAGSEKQRWDTVQVSDDHNPLVLFGAWKRSLHTKVGEVPVQNQTLECYWPDQPYTVSAVYDQEWKLREFYARLIKPVEVQGNVLQYVDLGRHLSVKPDYDYRIIEDAAPSSNGGARPDHIDVEAAWEMLLDAVEERSGPFDMAFFDTYKPK